MWRYYDVKIIVSRVTPKLLLNPYTWQILKIYNSLNPHQNQKEQFCEPVYFLKDGKNQNLLFSDLIFLFCSEISFSLWKFSRFLKLLYSVSDLFSELLVLLNYYGNWRIFSLVDTSLFAINLRKSEFLTLLTNNFILFYQRPVFLKVCACTKNPRKSL